jgi:hypothetical protein
MRSVGDLALDSWSNKSSAKESFSGQIGQQVGDIGLEEIRSAA